MGSFARDKGLLTNAALFLGAVAILIAAVTVSPLVVVIVFGVAASFRWPVAVFLIGLVGIEEETKSGGTLISPGPLVELGSQAYYWDSVGGVSVSFVVAVFTGLICWVRVRRSDRATVAICLGVVGWVTVLGIAQGAPPFDWFRIARPWIEVLFAVPVGMYAVSGPPRVRKEAIGTLVTLLTLKAMIGIYSLATGQTLPSDDLIRIVFYDSVTSGLAVAVLVGAVVGRASARVRIISILVASSIVIASMRRNTLAAGVIALLLLPLLHPNLKRRTQIYAGIAIVAVVVAIAFPQPVTEAWANFMHAVSAVLGTEGDTSSQGHVDDITVGAYYLGAAGLVGLGLAVPPLPGFVVTNSAWLYVHNEFLLDWLRMGFIGAALVASLVVLAVARSVRYMARRDVTFLGATAAAFFVGILVPLWFFPHLGTLQRWPLVFGFLLGVLAAQLRQQTVLVGADASHEDRAVLTPVPAVATSPGSRERSSPPPHLPIR